MGMRAADTRLRQLSKEQGLRIRKNKLYHAHKKATPIFGRTIDGMAIGDFDETLYVLLHGYQNLKREYAKQKFKYRGPDNVDGPMFYFWVRERTQKVGLKSLYEQLIGRRVKW